MNRRNFIAAIGAVCAFPATLFARSKPIHRFHKGSISGTFRPEELNLLTETKLNECLALWDKHRTKKPTIVLLSISNMENLMQDRYGPNWLKIDGIPTEVLQSFGCCPECSGRPPLLLQTSIDFQNDDLLWIGRREKDETVLGVYFNTLPLKTILNQGDRNA